MPRQTRRSPRLHGNGWAEAEADADYEVVGALREYDCGILEGRSDEAGWQMWQTLWDAWVKQEQWERLGSALRSAAE